jgi:Mn-dependent DtxR family transcriptional regulator
MNIKTKKLSSPQIDLLELIRQKGKVRCEDRIRRTYNKLIEYGLVDFDHSYDYIVLTEKGKQLEL